MIEQKDIEAAKKRLDSARAFMRIDEVESQLSSLENQIADPGFWDDTSRAQSISKHAGNLRETLEDFKKAQEQLSDTETAFELSFEDEVFVQEAKERLEELNKHLDALEVNAWFSGKYDSGDAIVSINPGAGGLEAQDWTEMLYRMYVRYAESKGWKATILDLVNGEEIGLDKAVIQIEGRNAYGMLRSESGVHRLVRISPTDEKKRRHTTFAAVAVMPVLSDDIDVDLDVNDVRVDVYRASGNGGQCVNTTDSAVRLTHMPTGIVVTCQNEKSQLQNKEAAFKVLRGKLFELAMQKRQAEIDDLRGDVRHIEFGSQIRNYVLYPYQLVKDVRTDIETGNVEAVLNGQIDEFVMGYHKWLASL
ncbi:MAG: peptide chain release factor 2 [Eggerthellaceae bacterium]|nr:peptide chain release factor 2 [Eggerthellaceae bacterium]